MTNPLELAFQELGVAVAVYKQVTRGRPVGTIPYWVWKLLHGRIDDDVRDHAKDDGFPGCPGGYQRHEIRIEEITHLLQGSERAAVEQFHTLALEQLEAARLVIAIAERVLASGPV